MNYKEITEPHNAQAVALFREHLPPHLAEMCVENHLSLYSDHNAVDWGKVNDLKTAVGLHVTCEIGKPFADYMLKLYECINSNTVNLEAFYNEFPDLRPTDDIDKELDERINEAFNESIEQKIVTNSPRFTVKIIDCQTNEAKQPFQTDRMVEAVSKFNELLELCGISEYSEFNNHLAGISQDGLLVILMEK